MLVTGNEQQDKTIMMMFQLCWIINDWTIAKSQKKKILKWYKMWEKRECNIWPLFSDFAEIYFHSCLASRNPWELFFVVNFFVKGHLSVPAHNLYINSNDVHLMTKHRFGWVMQLSSRLYPLCLTSIPSLCRFLTSLEIREAPTPSPHVQWRGKSCFVLQILPGFFSFYSTL